MTVFFLTLRRAPAPHKGERERERERERGGGGEEERKKEKRKEKRKKEEDYVIFSVVSWDLLSNVVLQEKMGVDIFFTSKGGGGGGGGGGRDRDRSNHQWEHYYQENHVLFRRWPRRWEHTEVSGCVNCVHPPRSGFRVCSPGRDEDPRKKRCECLSSIPSTPCSFGQTAHCKSPWT